MTDDNCEKSAAHALTLVIGEVINEAKDDRLPDDTIWYDDVETLAEAIARTIQEEVTQKGEVD